MTALLTETARDLMARLSEEEKRREGERLRRQVLRHFASSTDVLAGIILSAWKWIHETLEVEGFEGQKLAEYCRVLLEGTDWILAAHERFTAQAAASALTIEDAGLQDLQAKLASLQKIRPTILETLDLATRPTRPVEAAMLAASQAALQRGEFLPVDDEYLARLRADEDF